MVSYSLSAIGTNPIPPGEIIPSSTSNAATPPIGKP